MKIHHSVRYFLKNFFHFRVIFFMLTGAAVMFLTFLTNDNALEIAISGMASVFIGIGVNNLSSLETHLKDEQKIKWKTGHLLQVMEITRSQISRLAKEAANESGNKIKDELTELEQLISLGIQLIKEDISIN